MRFPPLYKDWLVVSLINQVGSTCASFWFSVSFFDCCMAIDGRWCCRTTVGLSDVARIMQLLEDDERLRVVARRLDVSPSVVIRLWIRYQETGEYTRNRVNAVPG